MAYPGGNGWQEQPQQPYQQQPQHGYPPQNTPQNPAQNPQQYSPYPQEPRQYPAFQQYPPDQGFQQFPQQGYQGFTPEPPKKSKKGLWIGLGALGVVIAVGATLFFVLPDGDDPQPQPVASPQASQTPPPSSNPPATSSSGDAPEDNKVPAVTPGWQGIRFAKDKVAYDLPPDGWRNSPGYVTGFTEGQAKIVVQEASIYKAEACPDVSGSYRGVVGFVTADQIPAENAARGAVRLWVQSSTRRPDGSVPDVPLPEVTPQRVAGGTIEGVSAKATFTPLEHEPCRAPTVEVVSAAFKLGQQTICFLMALDRGTPDALPEVDVQKILASLRPQP